MTFSEYYSEVLLPFIERYKTAKNDKERKAVSRNAAEAVKKSHDLREDEAMDLPKDLETAISRYIKGFIKKESSKDVDDPKPKKLKQKYKIRDVIKEIYRERVKELIPVKYSDKSHIGSYQKALSTVCNNLTDEELQKAESILDTWNEQGAPADFKLKNAKDKLPTEIKKRVDEWKFSSGAMVMCLVAYWDGKEVRGFHVESSPNVGNSFTNTHKDWSEGTYDNFKDWTLKQFGVEDLDSDDLAELPIHMQKAKDIEFDKNKSGQFILPPITDCKIIRDKQRVIRGYLGAVYREFTGNTRAGFPYLLASQKNQNIFSPECVPEGFVLTDPDHLKAADVDALYKHWLRRQTKKLPPFIVLNANPQHPAVPQKKAPKDKGKKTMDYVEDSSDDEDRQPSGDDEDGENPEEEVTSPVRRFGPPRGPFRKTKETAAQVAGTSKATSVEKVSKPKMGKGDNPDNVDAKTPKDSTSKTKKEVKEKKGRKEKKGSSKVHIDESNHSRVSEKAADKKPVKTSERKRLAKDEESPPSKRICVGKNDSNAEGSKKRRVEEQEGPPFKRKRTGGAESDLAKSKEAMPLPSQHQGRVREHSRVKEFPAGNATTSASRIAFLQSLCAIPKFLSLVDSVETVPKPSSIPDDFPSWASWKSRDTFLPANFHTMSAFKKLSLIAKKALEESSGGAKIDAPLLLIGLMYREVSRAMEIEPGGDTNNPSQLISSPFGIQQIHKLENLIEDVDLP